MTISTAERLFAFFFFVVILGTVWNTVGAASTTTASTVTSTATMMPSVTSTFGSELFVQRQAAFSKPSIPPRLYSEVRSKQLSFNDGESLSSQHAVPWVQLRGGEISMPDDDNEVSSRLFASKLRNVIRSLLQISDDKLPLVSGFLRTCFKTIESLTGLDLLPQPEEKSSKTKKSKAAAKKKKNKSKTKKTDESEQKETSEQTTTTTKKRPSKKKSSVPKKASATTTKHLSTSIKSNNPNYRIQKELKAFLKSPPDNLSVQVSSNIRLWIVTILGAKDTIYEGEVFKLRIEFPKDYPTVPPSVYFLKKFMPIHEHVYTNGDICLSLLGNGWRPTMSAQSIAVSILSILSSAHKKCLPMDNANQAGNKPGQYQKDWVYHDDSC